MKLYALTLAALLATVSLAQANEAATEAPAAETTELVAVEETTTDAASSEEEKPAGGTYPAK